MSRPVILGCTEIPLLIQQRDCTCPFLDAVRPRTEAALEAGEGERVL